MELLKKANKWLIGTVTDPRVLYLFIICFTGSLAILIYGFSFGELLSIAGLSALVCFIIVSALRLVDKLRPVSFTLFIFAALIFNLLAISDIFLSINFGKPFDQDIVDILADTNPRESSEFISTYLSPITGILLTIAVIAVNFLLFKGIKCLKIKALRFIGFAFLALTLLGVAVTSYGILNYALYRNGNSLPQYTSLTRVSHALAILNQRLGDIDGVYNACLELDVVSSPSDSTIYIVVIGESFSKMHSSLYGYEIDTNPYLKRRQSNGELLVFNDVVTIDDHTHTAIKSIFSFSNRNRDFRHSSLFPMAFKKAGFVTELYDNQYLIGDGITFLNDKRISNLMFDHRNSHCYDYDGNMLAEIEVDSVPSLIVVHLMGQHYTYSNRYPASFAERFDRLLYSHLEDSQKNIVYSYDMSIAYTDSILNAFMERFENDKVCLFYFSDHGEEVYDYGDFMGHGNAAHSSGLKAQIEVPFIIWGSDSFRCTDKWQRLLSSKDKRIITDDFSHTLIDLVEISTNVLDPQRSFINEEYQEGHRIVLNSIDYDNLN